MKSYETNLLKGNDDVQRLPASVSLPTFGDQVRGRRNGGSARECRARVYVAFVSSLPGANLRCGTSRVLEKCPRSACELKSIEEINFSEGKRFAHALPAPSPRLRRSSSPRLQPGINPRPARRIRPQSATPISGLAGQIPGQMFRRVGRRAGEHVGRIRVHPSLPLQVTSSSRPSPPKALPGRLNGAAAGQPTAALRGLGRRFGA